MNRSTAIKPSVKIFSSRILNLTVMALLVLGTFANIPIMNFTPAYAAPLTSVSVVPTSTLTGLATQYQVTFTTATTGTIHSIVITFPADYNFGTTVPNFVTSTNIRSDGTLAVDNTAKTLTYTLPRDQIITSGTTIVLSFSNVLNPTTNFASLSISPKTLRSDATVIDGPTSFTLTLTNNFATTAAGTITSAGALTVSSGGMTVTSGATTFLGNTDFGLGNTESVKLPAAGVILRNPAQTFATTLAGGAVVANRTLNLPVTTATDTLAALGMTQTWTGTKNSFTGNTDFLGAINEFHSGVLSISNPADTFGYSIAGSAITANRTLNLPLTTTTDTLAALGMTQTWTGTKNSFTGNTDFLGAINEFHSGLISISNPTDSFGTTLAGGAITANQTLNLPPQTQTETIAVQPTISFTTPANQTGTASLGLVMDGLGVAFTPKVTGRLLIEIIIDSQNGLAGDGCRAQIRYGTGVAPANGAAITGTLVGKSHNSISNAAGAREVIVLNGIATGLTVGTPYWIDVGFSAVTGNTCTLTNTDVSITEI